MVLVVVRLSAHPLVRGWAQARCRTPRGGCDGSQKAQYPWHWRALRAGTCILGTADTRLFVYTKHSP